MATSIAVTDWENSKKTRSQVTWIQQFALSSFLHRSIRERVRNSSTPIHLLPNAVDIRHKIRTATRVSRWIIMANPQSSCCIYGCWQARSSYWELVQYITCEAIQYHHTNLQNTCHLPLRTCKLDCKSFVERASNDAFPSSAISYFCLQTRQCMHSAIWQLQESQSHNIRIRCRDIRIRRCFPLFSSLENGPQKLFGSPCITFHIHRIEEPLWWPTGVLWGKEETFHDWSTSRSWHICSLWHQ